MLGGRADSLGSLRERWMVGRRMWTERAPNLRGREGVNTRRGAPLGPWTRPLRSRYARLDTSEVGEAGAPEEIFGYPDTLKT